MRGLRILLITLSVAVMVLPGTSLAQEQLDSEQEESFLVRTWNAAEQSVWLFINNTVEPFRLAQLEKAETRETELRNQIKTEKPAKDAPSLDKVVHLLRLIWRGILFGIVLILASKTLFLIVSGLIVFVVLRKIVRWVRYRIRGYE